MKKLFFVLSVMLGLLVSTTSWSVTPTPTPAIAAPTNVTVGVLQPNSAINLIWDADPIPTSWIVWFNGVQKYSVSKSDVKTNVSGSYSYMMQNLPPNLSISLTMTAQAPGRPTSPSSSAVLFTTSAAPFSYLLPLSLVGTQRFTVAGDGGGYGDIFPLSTAVKSYSVSVCGEGGSLSSWSVAIQGSLDGVHFTTFMTHDNGTTECNTISTTSSFYPYTYIRAVCNSLDLGTATDALVSMVGLP